jgi:hypothetical protein
MKTSMVKHFISLLLIFQGSLVHAFPEGYSRKTVASCGRLLSNMELDPNNNEENVRNQISPVFLGLGTGLRIWNRLEIGNPGNGVVMIADKFKYRTLSYDSVTVSFRVRENIGGETKATLRISSWKMEGDIWVLLSHQVKPWTDQTQDSSGYAN